MSENAPLVMAGAEYRAQRFFWSLGSGGNETLGGIIHFARNNFIMKLENFQYTVFKILA